jgi:phosphatidylinositol glycan class B
MISPIIHSLLTAIGDLVFYKYVKRLYGPKIAWTSTLLRCISWYSIYTSPRSLANSLEEFFTILVLYCLLNEKIFMFHVFAFAEFMIRPTAAINLIPIYFYAFFHRLENVKLQFVSLFLLAGLIMLPICTLIDSYFHGSFLLTPLNFLVHNVVNNVGIHYGTHPWHWYFSQGFPTILFAHIVPFLIGLNYFKKLYFEIAAVLFNIFVYSLLSHKEFRFLSQIMPFAMIICAFGVENFRNRFSKVGIISKIINRFVKFLMINFYFYIE